MLTELRKGLRLENPRLRRIVLAAVAVVIPLLVVLAPLVEQIGDEAGIAVGVVLLLWLVSVLVDHVVALSSGGGVEVFPNERTAMPRQLEFVRGEEPRFVEMCEYSTASVSVLMEQIANSTAVKSVRLLIASPATATEWQRTNRIVPQISQLAITFPKAVADTRGLEIRCYSDTPSLRGRNFGDRLVVTGWYTYDRRVMKGQEGDASVWGHNNALVVAHAGSAGWPGLMEMWREVFKNLWDRATPLRDSCTSIKANLPDQEWLEAVSGSREDLAGRPS